jgi:hypothetical protein
VAVETAVNAIGMMVMAQHVDDCCPIPSTTKSLAMMLLPNTGHVAG